VVNQLNRHTVRNLVIFTVVLVALGLLGRLVDSQMGAVPGEGPGMTLWILAPLLASFPLRAFAGDGWKDLGVNPAFKGNGLWYAVSILIYPVCVVLVVVLGRVFGALSLSGGIGDGIAIFAGLLIPQLITNILEESGIRGYLAPKLYTLGLNDFVAHAVVGLIWGAWHLPYLSYVLSYSTESLVTLIPRFLLGTIAASIVYGEIRLLTGSVWPSILMQTAGGTFIGTLVLGNFVSTRGGMDFLFAPAMEGGLIIVLFVLVGLWINRVRRGSQ
jgi:membrane protease YdiL (CAAX protease family)